MGKQSRKNKKVGLKPADNVKPKQIKLDDSNNTKVYDKDTAIFISLAQEYKDEGNKLFQKKDYEGAILKYERALKLLPGNHIDVSYLHSNIAACYMQMGISDFPRAIHECNLALEVTPQYSKALLKRARCYEALNRLHLALRDVNMVLDIDPKNLMAMEIVDRVKARLEDRLIEDEPNNIVASKIVDTALKMEPNNTIATNEITDKLKLILEKKCSKSEQEMNSIRIPECSPHLKPLKEKLHKKKNNKTERKIPQLDQMKENKDEDQTNGKTEKISKENCPEKAKVIDKFEKEIQKISKDNDKVKAKEKKNESKEFEREEKKTEDKLVVEERISTSSKEEEPKRVVKLVYGEDIRWAKVPFNCDILKLREIVCDRFPVSKAVLIKYRDEEGDMVTITTNEELRWAESLTSDERSAFRLYIVEVNPEQDPFFDHVRRRERNKKLANSSACIDDWILEFSQLFKNYAGFNSDACLDLHELGMKLYSEAMEETITSEESQELFRSAADKFQEMVALALFNWGNVHMSRARKRVYFTEDATRESILSQVKDSYEWAQMEYSKAGEKYEEAIKVKPDFYEGFLALGQQQFEKAKLSWYYALSTNVNLETWDSTETVQLYNKAEHNMENGMQMWEETEKERINEVLSPNKVKSQLQKTDLGTFVKDLAPEEAAEQAANMRSQMNVLWGTMLYERSIMEYKLGIPVWHECLEIAVEKFELAGASHTHIAVMIKNHCSNHTASEGLGFSIDEIVQAWNEMYEAKMWQIGVPSFRLEPLLRRRVSNLFHALEHA